MRRFFRTVTIVCLLTAVVQIAAAESPVPSNTEQLLVVTTSDWSTISGSLQRFERKGAQSNWRKVGDVVPIVVGRNGLGVGRGLNATNDLVGPIKREGDGKSPAGIFRISSAFGLPDRSEVNWIKLPYLHLTDKIECVDDAKSPAYNTIVDRSTVPSPDWDSSEKMKTYTVEYRLGATVDHNTAPRQNGAGSCIFLHIWKASDKPTSGCTAMTADNMEMLLRWLDLEKNPVMVQLPEADYGRLRKSWELPKVSKSNNR
jgi:D-alanyl-D-alanine dipeptidase